MKHTISLELERVLALYVRAYQTYIKLNFQKKMPYGRFSQIRSYSSGQHRAYVNVIR